MKIFPENGNDEQACYRLLVRLLHADGLKCPRCQAKEHLGVHRRSRDPVLDYQCAHCGRIFNAWTGTPLEKTHRRPSQILRILQGILSGTTTADLARQLGCQRAQLVNVRRRLTPLAKVLDEAEEPAPDAGPGGVSKPVA